MPSKQPTPPPILRLTERLAYECELAVKGFDRYHKYTLGTEIRKQYLPCQTDNPSPPASHDLPLITQQPHLQQEKCHAKTTDYQTVQPCFDFGNECS